MVLQSILGFTIGGGLGLAYYYFVGCQSGACPIQRNPYTMTIYGGVLGLIVAFS